MKTNNARIISACVMEFPSLFLSDESPARSASTGEAESTCGAASPAHKRGATSLVPKHPNLRRRYQRVSSTRTTAGEQELDAATHRRSSRDLGNLVCRRSGRHHRSAGLGSEPGEVGDLAKGLAASIHSIATNASEAMLRLSKRPAPASMLHGRCSCRSAPTRSSRNAAGSNSGPLTNTRYGMPDIATSWAAVRSSAHAMRCSI